MLDEKKGKAMIEIAYQLNRNDVIAASLPKCFPPRQIIASILLILFAVMSFNSPAISYSSIVGIILTIVALIIPTLGLIVLISVMTDKEITASTTLKISDSGIVYENSGLKFEIKWEAVSGWKEWRNYIVLKYVKKRYSMMIPKQSFSAEQLKIFMQYLEKVEMVER